MKNGVQCHRVKALTLVELVIAVGAFVFRERRLERQHHRIRQLVIGVERNVVAQAQLAEEIAIGCSEL